MMKPKKDIEAIRIEAIRKARVRQLFKTREDRTETAVLIFYRWLQQHHPELIHTPRQGDPYVHLMAELKGLYK